MNVLKDLLEIWKTRESLYLFPTTDIISTPHDLGIPYRDVNIKAGPLRINGWFMESPGSVKLMIFSHGNAGNISHRLQFIEFWNRHLSDHYSLFMYDYPTFGKSTCEGLLLPSVTLCKRALKAVVTLFENHFTSITLYGESIGGAITAVVATEMRSASVDKIVLQSTFTSLGDMASQLNGVIGFLAGFVTEQLDVMDACREIRKRGIDLVIMHSPDDELVPFSMFKRMKTYATSTLELKGGHNTTVFDESVADILLR